MMDLFPDDETEGFSFIWTIQNFRYCLQKKGERLSSPPFKLNLSDNNEWNLNIYPRSYAKDNYMGVFLSLHSHGPFPLKVKSRISIRASNDIFYNINEVDTKTFKRQESLGHPCFVNHSELYKTGNESFLENDTLTLRCRFWKENPELPLSGQCYARTVIDVKKIAFVWALENFKELLDNGRKTINFNAVTSQISAFAITICSSRGIHSERKLLVDITLGATGYKRFLACKLSLLDVDGETVQSESDEHWYDTPESTPVWHFTFVPFEKILNHEEKYLVNGALSLRCEFVVSSGEKFSEIERIEYGLAKGVDRKAVDTGFPGSCKDNLHQVFKQGKFSDLIIRTANKKFPVHKSILCTRSEVFSAMFDHDTKENRSGIVEIKDLNEDIVFKMLLYTYTDILEDLDWDTATELYFAADKYGIMALKRECSTFLKGNLDSSNVCEALVLADMHKDLLMISAAQDFIMDHASEIINSEYWKKFMHEKPNLASETLQVLFMKNLKI